MVLRPNELKITNTEKAAKRKNAVSPMVQYPIEVFFLIGLAVLLFLSVVFWH